MYTQKCLLFCIAINYKPFILWFKYKIIKICHFFYYNSASNENGMFVSHDNTYFSQGGHSNILVYTCVHKKHVKRGIFCSRTRKTRIAFSCIKCHVSGKRGWFWQNLLKFFRFKPIQGVKFETKFCKILVKGVNFASRL